MPHTTESWCAADSQRAAGDDSALRWEVSADWPDGSRFCPAMTCDLPRRSEHSALLTLSCNDQVQHTRTVLAYKLKANSEGVIDLKNALCAAGVPCDGCVPASQLCSTLRPAPRVVCSAPWRMPTAEVCPAAVRLEHPMRVSTYSRQFRAEHDSINADQPVSISSHSEHDLNPVQVILGCQMPPSRPNTR